MTYFKRYFTYRLRTTAFRTLILSVIAAVLSNVITSAAFSTNGRESGIGTVSIFIGIIAVLVPMLEIHQLSQRRTLDLVFALPVTKTQLALAHFLSGLCQYAAISTVAYLASIVAIASKNPILVGRGNTPYNIAWTIPFFLLSLLGGVVVYSVVTFLFSQGNTSADGMVFAFGAPGGFLLLCWYFEDMLSGYHALHNRIEGELMEIANIFVFITEPYSYYQPLIEPYASSYGGINSMSLIACFLWGLLGIASFIGFIYHVKNYRAEKAGGISDSFFGYRVLIPLYGCLLIAMNGNNIDLTVLSVLLVAMAVMYFVYRRSFKIKYADIACIVFAFLMVFTEGIL